MSYPSLTSQTFPNTPVNSREYQPNNPNSDKNLNPTFGGAGFTGSHTGPNGSGGSSLEMNIHKSDCSQYGVSVHQGIMRGTQNISYTNYFMNFCFSNNKGLSKLLYARVTF